MGRCPVFQGPKRLTLNSSLTYYMSKPHLRLVMDAIIASTTCSLAADLHTSCLVLIDLYSYSEALTTSRIVATIQAVRS